MRLVFLSLALVSGVVVGQCAAPAWSAVDSSHALNGPVNAMVEWDQGGPGPLPPVLVAAGGFNLAGTTAIPSEVAAWNGTAWQPLGAGATNASVNCLLVHNGTLIAGGAFSTMDGASSNHVVQWNGASWQSLGTGLNGQVLALAEHNGEIIAGGSFTVAGGSVADRVARWNGSSWQQLGSSLNGTVWSMNHLGADLVVTGSFNLLPTLQLPYGRVARWTGTSWTPLLGNMAGAVYASVIHEGSLVVAEDYGVERWDGTAWQLFPGGLGGSGYALTVYDGQLILGGAFTAAAGVPASNIARWTGSCWQPLGSGLVGVVGYGSCAALAVHAGSLFAGGNFNTAGGVAAPRIAQWTDAVPILSLTQAGAGGGVTISNSGLVTGHEYYNVASFDLCPGCVGSGPYGGLCFSDLGFLNYELSFGVGSYPFHFLAPGPTASAGPYVLAAGITFDAVCGDVTGGSLLCLSHVVRFAVQ